MLIYDDLKVKSEFRAEKQLQLNSRQQTRLEHPRGNKQWHVHRIPVLHKPITPCSDVPVYCTGQNRLQNICSILVGVYQANRFFPRCMNESFMIGEAFLSHCLSYLRPGPFLETIADTLSPRQVSGKLQTCYWGIR